MLKDLLAVLRRYDALWYLAFSDIRARYRRSVLGPLWLTLGTAVSVGGLGFLWSILLKTPGADLIPALTAGLIVWQFISGIIVESPGIFVRQAATIRSVPQSILIYPAMLVLRHAINLLHNLLVFVLVLAIFRIAPSLPQLLFLPCLLLVVLSGFLLAVAIGMVGARFRDIEPTIAAFLPLLFFISPVLYRTDRLPFGVWIVYANPATYFIEILRAPLLGQLPQPEILLGFGLVTLGIAACATLAYRSRGRLAFWV